MFFAAHINAEGFYKEIETKPLVTHSKFRWWAKVMHVPLLCRNTPVVLRLWCGLVTFYCDRSNHQRDSGGCEICVLVKPIWMDTLDGFARAFRGQIDVRTQEIIVMVLPAVTCNINKCRRTTAPLYVQVCLCTKASKLKQLFSTINVFFLFPYSWLSHAYTHTLLQTFSVYLEDRRALRDLTVNLSQASASKRSLHYFTPEAFDDKE